MCAQLLERTAQQLHRLTLHRNVTLIQLQAGMSLQELVKTSLIWKKNRNRQIQIQHLVSGSQQPFYLSTDDDTTLRLYFDLLLTQM